MTSDTCLAWMVLWGFTPLVGAPCWTIYSNTFTLEQIREILWLLKTNKCSYSFQAAQRVVQQFEAEPGENDARLRSARLQAAQFHHPTAGQVERHNGWFGGKKGFCYFNLFKLKKKLVFYWQGECCCKLDFMFQVVLMLTLAFVCHV